MEFRLDKAILRRWYWPAGTLFYLSGEDYIVGCADDEGHAELLDIHELHYSLTWTGTPMRWKDGKDTFFQVDVSGLIGFEATYTWMLEKDYDCLWKGEEVVSSTPYPMLPFYKRFVEFDKEILSRPLC